MRKFEFANSYEEIDIAGKIYKVDFSDDKLKEYYESVSKYQQQFKELRNVDTDNLTTEQNIQHFEEMKSALKDFMETLLGENTFDELYEKSGRSFMNLIDLAYELSDMIHQKGTTNHAEKRKQYVKKNKK